jgi:hypothetical protein
MIFVVVALAYSLVTNGTLFHCNMQIELEADLHTSRNDRAELYEGIRL